MHWRIPIVTGHIGLFLFKIYVCFFFKYELPRMIAREKFTGLSPEIIMEKFSCKIWLMHVVLRFCNKWTHWTPRSGESMIPGGEWCERYVAGSIVRFCNISNPIWVTLIADHYRVIYVGTSHVYCTFVAIWATFSGDARLQGIQIERTLCGTFQVKNKLLYSLIINTLKAMLI